MLWGLDLLPAHVLSPPSSPYRFYQSCRPSPIRRAALLPHCSLGPVCISCPLSHMVGSQWGDAWLLMIEPSLANRCYHLCKPLPAPRTHSLHKRCKRRTNVWIIWSQRQAQREIPDWMIIESGLLDFRIRAKKEVNFSGGGGFLDLCRQTLVISSSVGLYWISLKTWNRHWILMN